jgi:hypothetical protein
MLRRATWTLALALVVASCGGQAIETDGTAETESTAADGQAAATTSTSGSEDEADSLADFFGWPTGDDPAAAQAQAEEEQREIEELVAVCMANEGFEYIPVDHFMGGFDVAFDEEEFVREQGFGITTWYGNEEQFFGPEEDFVDPNAAAVEAMSDAERDAYFEALYGPPDQGEPQIDPETGEEYYEWEGFGEGCYGQAQEQIYGAQQEMWDELGPLMEEMWERIQADPRVAKANEGWSACMSDHGFDYQSPETMYETIFEDFQRRLDEIVGPGGGFADPFEGWTEDEINAFFEDKSDEEIEEFFRQAEQEAQQNVDQEALAELQQEERDLALANFECSDDTRDVMLEVQTEYEANFIRENRDTLEQIREAANG